MYAFRKGGVAMNSINIVDELGEMGIIVRVVELDSLLRWGFVADVYVEDYENLADFCTRYQVCMVTLKGDFVRLMVMEKG